MELRSSLPKKASFRIAHFLEALLLHKSNPKEYIPRPRNGHINRSMLFTIFSVLIIAGARTIAAGDPDITTIPLCCPSVDWRLAQVSGDLLRPKQYDCVDQNFENQTTILENTSPVYGIGIRRPIDHETNSSIPQCENHVLARFPRVGDQMISREACVMGMGNYLATISCSQETVQSISFVQKCCPLNYIYDSGQRKCVQNLETSNFHLYTPILGRTVIFNDNQIDCPRDKVLVEYKLNQYNFAITNGSLDLRPLRKKFESSQYCIEALDNVASRSAKPMTDQVFLVRTCDDVSSTCHRIPCIRRCCNDGEMFSKGNATSYCRRDETDTTYHSFESLEISGNFSKPSGMYN